MDANEKEFLKILKEKIIKFEGSIPLQHLTGHLSQVKPAIREAIGTSKYDLCRFIERHCNTFILEDGVVRLISSVKIKDYDSDDSSVEAEISLPKEISKGKGVVVKLTPTFGFIKIQHPVKSSAYFRAKDFGFPEQTDLTDCGIYTGTMVYLNAVRENRKQSSSKYRAKKVWKMNPTDEVPIQSTAPKKKAIRPDPVNLDGEGTVNNVFPTHGFITVDNDPSNSVFFYKKCVMNYDNITDLTKVFRIGELVEFSSHKTTKTDAKARWEATKVWKKSSVGKRVDASQVSSSSPMSTQNLSPKTKFETPEKAALLNRYHESIKNIDLTPKNRNREVIYDQVGKICPRQSGCVIKFGENLEQLADGDSCLYYIDGTKVQDVAWEFTEGDTVLFDAERIKSSPGWRALIVWMGGKRPVEIGISDWPELGSFSGDEDLDADEQSSVSSRDKLKSPSLADSAFSERPPSSLSSSKESDKSFPVTQPQKGGTKEEFNEPVKYDWYEMTIDYERSKEKDKVPPEQETAKKESSIKRYEDVQAKTTKVFSMFAEAELLNTSAAIKIISFSSNIFFKDRKSLKEFDTPDFRKILKVDQTITLNFFEIVDDSGQSWQKATLAWCGKKPKFVEMTPEEFIVQNKLLVSKRGKLQELQEKTPVSASSDNAISLNYLNEMETLKNSSENETTQEHLNVFARSAILEEPLFDYELFSLKICQKLMDRDVKLSDINLDALCSDIAKLLLQKDSYSCVGEKVNESLSTSDDCKDVEVQTLSTGPVWFPNVFIDN